MTAEDLIYEIVQAHAVRSNVTLAAAPLFWQNNKALKPLRQWINGKRPEPTRGLLLPWVGSPCPYCGRAMSLRGWYRPTMDHIRPRAKGGHGTLGNRNVIVVCQTCNNAKGTLLLGTWVDRLYHDGDPRHLTALLAYWDMKARGLSDLVA